MKKAFHIILSILLTLPFVACQEKGEEYEFDNWQKKNEQYIDSIAQIARSGKGWTMYKSYNLGDSLDMNGENKFYIYVQKLENGNGKASPLFNDSVRVHYKGYLIPSATYPTGYCFDKSYSGSVLNLDTDVPTLFGVNSVVKGFSTALMHMKEGDYWRVVIPYYLGYGTEDKGKIPGYSTLVFECYLARIYNYKKGDNTDWH